MPFIGTGGRAAGRPRGRLGALLAAVAVTVAAGVAAAGVATSVTITGTGLTGATTVYFGTVPAWPSPTPGPTLPSA